MPNDAPQPPRLAFILATWFGTGLSPKAPGTVGSLGSLVVWAPLVLLDTAWWIRLIVTVVIFIAGTLASEAMVKARGEDPQLVVIDEVAGMGVTLLFAGAGWPQLVLGFLCFRLFDIWKPWPVRVADDKVGGGFGVMLDDILAGIYALLLLTALERYALPLLLPVTTS